MINMDVSIFRAEAFLAIEKNLTKSSLPGAWIFFFWRKSGINGKILIWPSDAHDLEEPADLDDR